MADLRDPAVHDVLGIFFKLEVGRHFFKLIFSMGSGGGELFDLFFE